MSPPSRGEGRTKYCRCGRGKCNKGLGENQNERNRLKIKQLLPIDLNRGLEFRTTNRLSPAAIRPMRIAVLTRMLPLLLLISAAVVNAADRYRGPTTRPSHETAPAATLVNVSGTLQFRASPYDQWQNASRGVQLPFDGEIRLAPRAAAQFQFADNPDRTITLDRMAVVKVERLWEWSKAHPLPSIGNVRYDGQDQRLLGVRYDRTDYEIEKPGMEHVSEVRFPSSTLAIRDEGVCFFPSEQERNWFVIPLPGLPPLPVAGGVRSATAAASRSAASTRSAR
jgi:hypothetical protein